MFTLCFNIIYCNTLTVTILLKTSLVIRELMQTSQYHNHTKTIHLHSLQTIYYTSEALKPVYTLSGSENLRRIAFTTQAGTTLLFPFPRKLYVQLVNWQ